MDYDVIDIRKRKGLLWKIYTDNDLEVIVKLENNKKVIIYLESKYVNNNIDNEDTRIYLIKIGISRKLHKQYKGITFKLNSFIIKIPYAELSNESKELLK